MTDRQQEGREGSQEKEVRRAGKMYERMGTEMKLQYLFLLLVTREGGRGAHLASWCKGDN